MPGTPPNTSLVLTDEELQYIDNHFGGSKSAAIHRALERIMLTEHDMLAAYFARMTDTYFEAQEESPAQPGAAWAEEMGDDPTSCQEKYEHGKAILEEWKMDLSGRRTVLHETNDLPANSAAHIVVSAGHIATSPAYRYASFSPRR